MQHNSAKAVRQTFLDFFKQKAHQIVPSSPIVVKNDPTLLFTNAGMNQFKDIFLGNNAAQYTRVADTQKCLRVSGKHNDLEEVGVDTYHHTMFEMLGNWSFGDYFKEEAIGWSWELLTDVFKIPKDRLYVTVFGGDDKDQMEMDAESQAIWSKYIDKDRILLGSKKDNFWEMGDTGPCGPCTEIHVDCRPDEERQLVDGKTLVNADHPQVIEIWNNVFIQFNRDKSGQLEPLPAKHVDTGMGFERLVRVLQGKQSNYDTDVFMPIIQIIENIVKLKYDPSTTPQSDNWGVSVAFRVLADHIRAIVFTIADGQLPASTGAGYVIRRILRRAVRYYYSNLNYQKPLLYQLLPVVVDQFGEVFPEIVQQQAFIERVIKEEEESFLKTIDKGLRRLDEAILKGKDGQIDGRLAFVLYDTYGFPIDLTQLIASEKQLHLDMAGFEAAMKEQVERSRQATLVDADDWVVLKDVPSHFIGYDDLRIETVITKYRKVSAKGQNFYQIVLETTPFYAESGGQVGDTGQLITKQGAIAVFNTKKDNDLIVHYTASLPEFIGEPLIAEVDSERRLLISYNHSATHLMHAALRSVLGNHVVQKGSLVNDSYLRFDFAHFEKMTEEQIREVDILVNKKIRENIEVIIEQLPKEEAIAKGAMALFGEKYADVVRVVTMDPNYSIELCGGTHVKRTGMIGMFKIMSESAVAAGVRRIEAYTGPEAIRTVWEYGAKLKAIAEVLKAKDPVKAVEKLMVDKADLQKQILALQKEKLVVLRSQLQSKFEMVAGTELLLQTLETQTPDHLKQLAHDLSIDRPNSVVVLQSLNEGKAALAIAVGKLTIEQKGLDAGQLVKSDLARLVGGGGGGQKGLALAGGSQLANWDDVRTLLVSKLSS